MSLLLNIVKDKKRKKYVLAWSYSRQTVTIMNLVHQNTYFKGGSVNSTCRACLRLPAVLNELKLLCIQYVISATNVSLTKQRS